MLNSKDQKDEESLYGAIARSEMRVRTYCSYIINLTSNYTHHCSCVYQCNLYKQSLLCNCGMNVSIRVDSIDMAMT